MSTIFEKVKQILITRFSVPAENIHPDSKLEAFGLDSLDYIELLFEVEDAFNIRVPQEGAPAVTAATVNDIVESIEKLVETQQRLTGSDA